MALQGTLDTFELPDVLRLLASTRKTGRLTLRSDRGQGDVWLEDGRLVAAETANGAQVGDALFELLRAHEGAFAFAPGEQPASPLPPADVEPLLADAEALLAEWRDIEAVVPSVHSWVALNTELPSAEVTVDADTWRLVAVVGSGLTVADLDRVLGLGEVAVSRLVRDLVGLGLGVVTVAPEPAVAPTPAPDPVAVHTYRPAVDELHPTPEAATHEPTYEPAHVPADGAPAEPVVGPSYEPVPAPPLFAGEAPTPLADVDPVAEPSFEPAASPFAVAGAHDDTDEVTRQLAMLSPQAAQAVAAVASYDDRVDAMDGDELDDGDEPVNRGLLLKFLGSVKS